jgi:toxin HigB-1
MIVESIGLTRITADRRRFVDEFDAPLFESPFHRWWWRTARAPVKEFSGFARQAEKRLDRLEAATSLQDLAALPGNALEPLRGDRKGQYSIRINDQWRICFEWPKGGNGPVNVEITDYH